VCCGVLDLNENEPFCCSKAKRKCCNTVADVYKVLRQLTQRQACFFPSIPYVHSWCHNPKMVEQLQLLFPRWSLYKSSLFLPKIHFNIHMEIGNNMVLSKASFKNHYWGSTAPFSVVKRWTISSLYAAALKIGKKLFKELGASGEKIVSS